MGAGPKISISDDIRRIMMKQEGSNRLKSLGIVQDVNSFIVTLWQALQLHRPKMVFEPAYPSYVLDIEDANVLRKNRAAPEIPEEIMTWNVVRRTPGSIDHKAFARSREIRPRIREEMVYYRSVDADPYEPELSKTIDIGSQSTSNVIGMEVEGQFFDNLVQFDIWSKNNKTAEILANYFEEFMEDFHGMFIQIGVTKIHFHSRVRDEVILNWRNGLVNRSLLYYVRTERVRATPVREIKVININTEVREYLNQIDELGVDRVLALQQDQIVNQWVQRNRNP